MDLSKKLLTILLIFCIASAGAVCAADDGDSLEYDYADDMDGYDGSHYDDDDDADSHYEDVDDGDDDDDDADSHYDDDKDDDHTDSQNDDVDEGGQYKTSENAAGEPVNQTAQSTTNDTIPVVGNAGMNVTNSSDSSHSMLGTGNPIVALMAVGGVLGGYTILRRE